MLIGKAVVRGVPKVHVHPPLGLKRPPDPSPNNFAPPISNSWLRPCTVRTQNGLSPCDSLYMVSYSSDPKQA